MRPSLFAGLAGAGGLGAATIGGVTIGDAGTGFRTGYVLADGDEFTALDIYHSNNQSGSYFTTRAYRQNNSVPPDMRAPNTGPLAVMHDVDPYYSGWMDANRGLALGFDSHQIVAGEGTSALRLRAIRQTAPEQAMLATGVAGQIERGSMIHTAARLWINNPGITEFRARIPVGPAGHHPTVWLISANPPGSTAFTGNEYGYEGSGATQQAYHINWTAGAQTSENHVLGSTYRDDAYHTYSIVATATQYLYYIDGALVFTNAVDPDNNGNKAEYLLITNHVYNATFLGQAYSASEWAAASSGVDIDLEWIRVWRSSSGAYYAPLVDIPDTLVSYGQAFSVVLPAQIELWGATGLTEYVCAMQSEVEEPGGNDQASYSNFPVGVTYNSDTRTLSGTLAGDAGVLHVVVGVTQDGVVCKPARVRICVAPRFGGLTALKFLQGRAVSLDVYYYFSVGRQFAASSNPKGLAATGLPAGLALSGATGLITGTPTTVSSGTVALSSTNAIGQTTTVNIDYSVTATATGVAAPTITGSPALVASWDFDNAATVTASGGRIDSVSGSDGTSVTLSGTGGTRPTLGNRYGRNVADFDLANGEFLQVASGLGLNTTGATIVAICEFDRTLTQMAVVDIANGAATAAFSRHLLMAAATSGGVTMRKADASVTSDAQDGAYYAKGGHLLLGTSGATTGVAGIATDGKTATFAFNAPANPSGLTHTTVGARRVSGAQDNPFDGAVMRVLVYSAPLNSTQREEVAVWAAANYGTANLA